GVCYQIIDGVTECPLVEVGLLISFRIHEVVIRTVGVEILHFTIIENRFLNPIFRSESMVDDCAATKIPQLCLNHTSPVSRRDVRVIHHLKEFSIVQNRVSFAELGRLNHYRQAPRSLMKTTIVTRRRPACPRWSSASGAAQPPM